MDKLDFLNKYRDNVELVSINDVDSFITNEWKNVFKEETQNKRVKNTISIWKKHCEKELRNTINYLSEHLIDVSLIKTSYGISVIYELIMMDGSIDYYAVSYTHLRAHETRHDLVCRLLLEKKKKKRKNSRRRRKTRKTITKRKET